MTECERGVQHASACRTAFGLLEEDWVYPSKPWRVRMPRLYKCVLTSFVCCEPPDLGFHPKGGMCDVIGGGSGWYWV